MSKSKVTLGVRCGSCIHYNSVRLFEQPCSQLGVSRNQVSPNCYKPNVSASRNIPLNTILNIGRLTKDLDVLDLQYLSFVFLNASQLQDTPFKFGQPVYVCLGENYLSHYFSGYVTGVAYSGEHIIVSSMVEDSSENTSLMLYPESVLTKSQFAKIKARLIAAGRIERKLGESERNNLPIAVLIKDGKYEPKAKVLDDYIPPSLDTAPAAWHKKQEAEYDYTTGKEVVKARKVIPIRSEKSARTLEDIGTIVQDETDGTLTYSV